MCVFVYILTISCCVFGTRLWTRVWWRR